MSTILEVGDKMRFSVELIEQIREIPDQRTELVEVVEIRVEDDGTKMVTLKRAEKNA